MPTLSKTAALIIFRALNHVMIIVLHIICNPLLFNNVYIVKLKITSIIALLNVKKNVHSFVIVTKFML